MFCTLFYKVILYQANIPYRALFLVKNGFKKKKLKTSTWPSLGEGGYYTKVTIIDFLSRYYLYFLLFPVGYKKE